MQTNKNDNSPEVWFSTWVKMPYEIVDKEVIEEKRRELIGSKLKDEELKLPFSKYITAPFKPVKETLFNPFKQDNQETNEPPYLELVKLNLDCEKSITEYVNNFGLLGLMYHSYRWFDIRYNHTAAKKQPKIKGSYSNWHKYHYNTEPVFPMDDEKIEKLGEKETLLKKDTDYLILRFIHEKAYDDSFLPMTKKEMNDIFCPLNRDPYRTEPSNLLNPEGHITDLLHLVNDQDFNQFKNRIDPDISKKGFLYQLYSEPLELFIEEACKFQKIYSIVDQIEKTEPGKDQLYLLIDLYYGVWKNLKPIHPKPRLDKKGQEITFGWEIPSLLSAYYLMFYVDLTKMLYMRFCANKKCRKPFVTSIKSKKNCGHFCRSLVRKQKQLSREKDYRESLQSQREKYKPVKVKFLLVVEFDREKISNDSFYLTESNEKDILFVEVIRTLYPDEYFDANTIRSNKRALLERLKNEGFYMIDGSKQDRQKKVVLSTIKGNVKKVSHKSQTKIIVISTDHGVEIINYLRKHGYRVINDDVIEFPHGPKLREQLRKKLKMLLEKFEYKFQ